MILRESKIARQATLYKADATNDIDIHRWVKKIFIKTLPKSRIDTYRQGQIPEKISDGDRTIPSIPIHSAARNKFIKFTMNKAALQRLHSRNYFRLRSAGKKKNFQRILSKSRIDTYRQVQIPEQISDGGSTVASLSISSAARNKFIKITINKAAL